MNVEREVDFSPNSGGQWPLMQWRFLESIRYILQRVPYFFLLGLDPSKGEIKSFPEIARKHHKHCTKIQ